MGKDIKEEKVDTDVVVKTTSKLSVFKDSLKHAVMEPYLMLVMFAYMCRSVTNQNLLTDKCCLVYYAFDEKICNNLHNYTEQESQVQSVATAYHTGSTVLSIAPAIVVTILLGSWSDIYGRKIPLIIATVGLIIELGGLMVNVIGFYAPLGLMLVPASINGLTGGLMVIMTSAISYISDVTNSENRAIRFAILELSFIVAGPIGTAVGGIIFKNHGYLAVFSTSIAIDVVALVYIAIRLKEPEKKKIANWREVLSSLFSLENVKSNIKTCTRQREGSIRKEIWLMFIGMFCSILVLMGTMGFAFFFTQKMYGWDNYHYSMVSMVFSIITGLTIVSGVTVMTKVLKLHDAMISLIGTILVAASTALKGVAYKEWMYFLACLIGLLGGTTNIGVRSRLSKLVAKDEIGKVFSVLALCESLAPIIAMVVFGSIYSETVSFFPGLAYIVAASILVIPLFIFIWIYKWGINVKYEELNAPLAESELEMPVS